MVPNRPLAAATDGEGQLLDNRQYAPDSTCPPPRTTGGIGVYVCASPSGDEELVRFPLVVRKMTPLHSPQSNSRRVESMPAGLLWTRCTGSH